MNLTQNRFTNQSDLLVYTEWTVPSGATIYALNGNDIIAATANGFLVAGTFRTGNGNDTIASESTREGPDNSIDIFDVINTGSGDDTITGTGTALTGLFNDGSIITGEGEDTILGTGNFGIENGLGSIGTGIGNDTIIGKGTVAGIYNESGSIETDAGDDMIIGKSERFGILNQVFRVNINTGDGDDTITGISTGTSPGDLFDTIGIRNTNGSINSGAGNDTITGRGILAGIQNYGEINTSQGNDIVDALNGGFDQISSRGDTGTVNLGIGSDTLKGFGTGIFNGGGGVADKILLDEGSYTISAGQINGDMNVSAFEWIGGINGGLFAFRDGTLTVDSQGDATFVAV